ncbi:MAG: hypothetical protein C5B60_00855 [Chloroflexi bacterium]|nr:MAG: hypothetical protein C5B60_00855 [Chloroflexota bacterium]
MDDDQSPDVTESVEVSDLHEKSAAASPSVGDTRRSQLTLTPRQRMQRLAVAGGSVVLALLILVTAVPGLRTGARSLLAGFVPTPTATLPPGTDRFYFIASVPNIQLSIDGRPVSHLPRIGTDLPLVLARGRHHIYWKGAPFLPQSCVLSVPFGISDNCGTPVPVLPSTPQGSFSASMVLLRESLVTLSTSQQSAVAAVIQNALPNSTSGIQPGDHYAVAQVATQPLRGTLVFQLATSNAFGTSDFGTGDACGLSSQSPYIVCNFAANPCAVCTIPAPALASTGVAVAPSSWYVVTFAGLSYTISTLTGHTLIANGPISPGGLAGAIFPILIALTWDGAAWHAQPFLGPAYDALLARLDASAAISSTQTVYPSPYFANLGCAAMPDFFSANGILLSNSPYTFIGTSNPADGCLAIESVPSTSGTEKAYYLYRFGGLIAVNDLAHRLAPSWPIASAHERQIAAALLSGGTPTT